MDIDSGDRLLVSLWVAVASMGAAVLAMVFVGQTVAALLALGCLWLAVELAIGLPRALKIVAVAAWRDITGQPVTDNEVHRPWR